MNAMLLGFLTIACCSCSSKTITKTEYITERVPDELLETPFFDLKAQKASDEKEVVASYIILWSFYEDLRVKIEKIRALQTKKDIK